MLDLNLRPLHTNGWVAKWLQWTQAKNERILLIGCNLCQQIESLWQRRFLGNTSKVFQCDGHLCRVFHRRDCTVHKGWRMLRIENTIYIKEIHDEKPWTMLEWLCHKSDVRLGSRTTNSRPDYVQRTRITEQNLSGTGIVATRQRGYLAIRNRKALPNPKPRMSWNHSSGAGLTQQAPCDKHSISTETVTVFRWVFPICDLRGSITWGSGRCWIGTPLSLLRPRKSGRDEGTKV